jgi:hypothetical protein
MKQYKAWELLPEEKIYLKSEADKVIARHKYKRCLTMAKACHEKSERMYCEASSLKARNEILGKEPKDAVVEKFELWGAIASTHRKIWLALAEKPTWAKFLQLIHKEHT